MKKRVFITGISLKLPEIDSVAALEKALQDPAGFSPEFNSVRIGNETDLLLGKLQLDETSPFFPKRSDLKVMRQDVAAAAVCAAEVMTQSNIPVSEWADIPLFMANGICVEKQEDEELLLKRAYMSTLDSNSEAEKQATIYKTIPPLLALRTLTNSAESFVAQYTGLAGSNTTFGNTSHSGFSALKEAFSRITSGSDAQVIVGSSHAAGTYSYLTFRNFTNGDGAWRESVGSAFLLLESEESCLGRQAKPLAEIKNLAFDQKTPSLFRVPGGKPYSKFSKINDLEFGVFSGGLSGNDYLSEKNAMAEADSESFSWYPFLGHLGAASVLVNVATAVSLLKLNNKDQIHCFDKDAYGRESAVLVAACNSETV